MNFLKLFSALILILFLAACTPSDRPLKNQNESLNSKARKWVAIDAFNYVDKKSIEKRGKELYYMGYFAGSIDEPPFMTIRGFYCLNGVRKIYKSTSVAKDGSLAEWIDVSPVNTRVVDHETPTASQEYKEYKQICY